MKQIFSKYSYVFMTLLNSGIGFVKSYLFMDLLTKTDLGYIAIFQSVVIMVGFLQVGVIHGGYRIVSFSLGRKRMVNNIVGNYILLLSFVLIILSTFYTVLFRESYLVFAAILVGVMSLLMNWVTNIYVALGYTKQLGRMMLVSILLSLTPIPLLQTKPLVGAILLLGLQPLCFLTLSLLFYKEFRFSFFKMNFHKLKWVVKYGFAPFLTSILYLVNMQIERWIINIDLGVKSLGDYYLVFVYTSIFSIIPSSLATLNFPSLMKKIRGTVRIDFFIIFKIYYLELLLYVTAVFFATYFLMPILVQFFLPKHVDGIKYVKIISLGLIVYTLIDPISFLMNAKLDYRSLVAVYIFAIAISIIAYSIVYLNGWGSLLTYSYVNVLFFLSMACGYIVYFVKNYSRKFTS